MENSDLPSQVENSFIVTLSKTAVDWAQEGKNEIALTLLQTLIDQTHSGLAYYKQAKVYAVIASRCEGAEKEANLKKAISSVEQSVRISPNSLYFACFLSQLRTQTAWGVKEYQSAAELCKKALRISQPTDPLVDDPVDGGIGSTTPWRIECVRKRIQYCIDQCNLEIQEKIKAYWGSLSVAEQRSYLKVSITDLISFCKDKRAVSAILEATAFAVKNRHWKGWICYSCNQKFPEPEAQFRHLSEQHMQTLSSILKSVLPSKLDTGWCEVINKGRWGSVNRATVPEQEAKWQARLQFPGNEERSKETARGGPVLTEWDLTNDFLCIEKLTTIRQMLKDMLSNKSLSAELVHKVTKFSMDKLKEKNIIPRDSNLWEAELDKNHLCICLLEDVDLDEIVNFLEKLHQFSMDLLDLVVETFDSNRMASPIQEWIYCDGDLLCLVLDDDDDGNDHASAIKIDVEDQGPPDLNALLEWCLADPTMEDGLDSWQ